jgi:NADH:ubiquinone oxidoreductase subunit 4 (subunit M)
MFQRTAFGLPKAEFEHAHIHDVHGPEWLAWAPMLALIVILGVFPGLLFQITDGAVQSVTSAFATVAGN